MSFEINLILYFVAVADERSDEPEDDDCAYATDAKPSAAAATTTGIFFIMISFVTVGQRRGITRNRQGRSGKSAKPVA